MPIYATRTPVRPPTVMRACTYCGREREARKDAVLCKDCVYVLPAEVRALWAA